MATSPTNHSVPKPQREDARRRGESSQTGSDKGAKGPRSPDEPEKGDRRRTEGGPGQGARRGRAKQSGKANT